MAGISSLACLEEDFKVEVEPTNTLTKSTERAVIDYNTAEDCITIKVDGRIAKFDKYCKFKDRKAWVNHLLHQLGHDIYGWHPKERNKMIAEFLGCSTVKLYNHFQKLQYKVFVAPYVHVLSKVDYCPWGIRASSLERVRKYWPVLKEVADDGLDNLLPICAAYGLYPHELKEMFKGKWKLIANNSTHKNGVIAKYKFGGWMIPLVELAHIPTTVLKVCRKGFHRAMSVPALEYLTYNFKGKWSNETLMREQLQLFLDTERMASQLDKPVNPKWSPRRLNEEHDKMAQEINAKQFPKTKFESTKDIKVKRVEYNGYVATLLESAFEIAEEGNAMGHCVAGYSEYVKQGRYLVYSVTKNGERSSTIGINRTKVHIGADGNTYWTKVRRGNDGKLIQEDNAEVFQFSQHYRKFNQHVYDPDEAMIHDVVLTQLNEKPLTKVNNDGTIELIGERTLEEVN